MRYFFHLLNGADTVLDEEGQEFGDIADVRTCAAEEARSLMADDIRSGFLNLSQCIEVRDCTGETVHVQRFADAVQITGTEQPQL